VPYSRTNSSFCRFEYWKSLQSSQTTYWNTIHVIYYLSHWLSKWNICLLTIFRFFIPFSTVYLFKNDSSFSRFVYLINLPADSTMPNLEISKNAHTLITIYQNNTSVMWFVTRSSYIVCIKTVHLTIQDWYSWPRVFFLKLFMWMIRLIDLQLKLTFSYIFFFSF